MKTKIQKIFQMKLKNVYVIFFSIFFIITLILVILITILFFFVPTVHALPSTPPVDSTPSPRGSHPGRLNPIAMRMIYE